MKKLFLLLVLFTLTACAQTSVPIPSRPAPPVVAPLLQMETITLTGMPATSTQVVHALAKTPASGVVIAFYVSQNILLSQPITFSFSGNPITFMLPTGWSTADTIVCVYQ